ncbi:3-isopropylmalate dehydratase [bacterium]|nr:3-isopropylmalate dehydratase [bacterium]
MNKQTKITGKIWIIKDENGCFVDDIDTDQIFHNKYLAITDIEKMGEYAFSNLDGWEDFPDKVKEGDILVVGANFGAGSSRQQAVDCFTALGVKLIIGESFGAIYWRNAVNSGVPILVCEGIKETRLNDRDEIEVDLLSGEIVRVSGSDPLPCAKPFTKIQKDIYESGSLLEYGKKVR